MGKAGTGTVLEKVKPKRKSRRDYFGLVNEMFSLIDRADLNITLLKNIRYGTSDFPFFMLKSQRKEARYNVVITAGAHGNEVVGIKALLWALERLDVEQFNFYIFPILNPWGYANFSRKTGDRKGINRRVGKRDLPEINLVLKNIPFRIDLFIDVHSDVDKPYVYAYERRDTKKKSLARIALQDVEPYFDIAENATIYEEPCKDGVVTSYDGENTLEELMYDKGATYSITAEIPGRAKEADQIKGGARLILALLNNFADLEA